MRIYSVVIIAFVLSACASTAEPTTKSDVAKSNAKTEETVSSGVKNQESTAEGEHLICRSEQIFGTNKRTRVCRKASN